ncbi:unnamed protein product [Symbiodinium natans]|uniref:Uncharacterized protein n=1 Tax=Symbiodinium natans TaxID=878477 RepID=A0A812RGD8_9DINO|nr:unnamed protein product [Symbiodinium natans]
MGLQAPCKGPFKALEGWVFFDGSQIPFTKGPLERVVLDVPKNNHPPSQPRGPFKGGLGKIDDSHGRRPLKIPFKKGVRSQRALEGWTWVDSGPATQNGPLQAKFQNHLSHSSRTCP